MYTDLLKTVGSPNIVSSFDDMDFFESQVWKLRSDKNAFVSVMRGQRMRTFEAFDQEIAAAMQFPWYYGKNNNALRDCLGDLAWLNRDVFILAITNSEFILQEEIDDDKIRFGKILVDTCEIWSLPYGQGEWWERPGWPFHVLMHFGDKSAINNFGDIFDTMP